MNDFREYSAAFHYLNGDIMHFGILGMKWGVRRYQNEDGSLTAAGRKHYSKEPILYTKDYQQGRLKYLQEERQKLKNIKKDGFEEDEHGNFVKDIDGKEFDLGSDTEVIKKNYEIHKEYMKNREEHDKNIKNIYDKELVKYRDDYVSWAKKHGINQEAIDDNVKYFNDMIKKSKEKPYSYAYNNSGQLICFFEDGVDNIFGPTITYDVKRKKGNLSMDD